MQEEVLFSSSPALYFALLPRQSSLITCLALITTKRIIILLNFFKVSHFSSTTGSEREPQRAPVIPNVINGNLAPPPMMWIQFELETVNYPVSFLHRKWKMDRTHFCVAVAWHDHKCSLWLDFYIKWIQIPHQLIAWKYLYSMSQHFVFSSWWINVLIGLLN